MSAFTEWLVKNGWTESEDTDEIKSQLSAGELDRLYDMYDQEVNFNNK